MGYRYYDRHKGAAKYPFGYGLSYSKFEYSDLSVKTDGTDAEVSFTVKNTSGLDGKEIAQVYVSECSPTVYRPLKELKGFKKELIKAGESKRFTVRLNSRSFAYYSVADDAWTVNDGIFRIFVGSSAEDIRLVGTVHIKNNF